MTKRRRSDRERLEIYLMHVLLAFRPLFRIIGFILLILALAIITFSNIMGGITLISAIFLLLLTYSYEITLDFAKFGAWIGTVGEEGYLI
ncbi:MAG: hypothetical protein FVQ83_04500 [Chloroflexi bacterium]|nr:hypothetical protein [Chloroflexota bacterium]